MLASSLRFPWHMQMCQTKHSEGLTTRLLGVSSKWVSLLHQGKKNLPPDSPGMKNHWESEVLWQFQEIVSAWRKMGSNKCPLGFGSVNPQPFTGLRSLSQHDNTWSSLLQSSCASEHFLRPHWYCICCLLKCFALLPLWANNFETTAENTIHGTWGRERKGIFSECMYTNNWRCRGNFAG